MKLILILSMFTLEDPQISVEHVYQPTMRNAGTMMLNLFDATSGLRMEFYPIYSFGGKRGFNSSFKNASMT